MSDERHVPEAEIVADLARAAAEPKPVPTDVPSVIVVPAEAQTAILDVSAWRQQPVRRQGVFRPATVDALVAFTNLHGVEQTSVWVHPTSGKVVTVFDDHDPDVGPGYGGFRAELSLAPTPEWMHWMSLDGKLVTQEHFAEHVEAGLQEIEQPDGATMLELAQSFRLTNNASFRTAKRLVSGEQQFLYDETVEVSAGRGGEITVPATFVLLVAPFVGEDETQVVAKLRYRMNGGSFAIGYKLERPDKVVRDALDRVADQLAERFPRTFVGEPAIG